VVAIIGIIAAIAIPSLLRARVSANEAACVGDMRTVISSEAAYSSSNAGFYDDLTCLATPSACIPGYQATSPTFLDPNMGVVGTTKQGYTRFFHPGANPPVIPTVASGTSMVGYVYGGTPTQQDQTGVKGFAADATGIICFDPAGADPSGGAASLPNGCAPI
jgi:hypothetical protein